jgi:2-amino-4-hydroxy-6-hydroxymethyldihydropteridine diphosphokinase
MITIVDIVIGLGGNLGQTDAAFVGALEALAEEGRVRAVSRVWRTRPVGPSQPEFLNAAAVIDWPAGPRPLLERCREIEADAGRDRAREQRWGPRILDLDLLIAASTVCRGPDLDLPHPRLHERRFALEPAAELVPGWVHPLLGLTVEELAEKARRRDPDAILEIFDFEFSSLNS